MSDRGVEKECGTKTFDVNRGQNQVWEIAGMMGGVEIGESFDLQRKRNSPISRPPAHEFIFVYLDPEISIRGARSPS